MIREIWRDVEGFEEFLMVSNLGRVFRKEKIINTKTGDRKIPSKMASLSPDKNGYMLITLSIGSVRKTLKVHRLVAKAFCDGYDEVKNEVNHIDGNKANNIYSNLEWVSRNENMKHAVDSGLWIKRELQTYDFNCKKCGDNFSSTDKDRKFCSEKCSKDYRRVVKRPSKEELLRLISTYPFTKIAEIYSVSDNAIRKWCKYYNLPYRKKDIDRLKTG